MKTEILESVESKCLKKDIPHFEVGDTVDVHCKIKEGDKERIQVFSGIVISRKGHGMNEFFTVRRVVDNEGVERIFPMHSPNIASIKPVRSGRRRAPSCTICVNAQARPSNSLSATANTPP